jgi:hypothetical protein
MPKYDYESVESRFYESINPSRVLKLSKARIGGRCNYNLRRCRDKTRRKEPPF